MLLNPAGQMSLMAVVVVVERVVVVRVVVVRVVVLVERVVAVSYTHLTLPTILRV